MCFKKILCKRRDGIIRYYKQCIRYTVAFYDTIKTKLFNNIIYLIYRFEKHLPIMERIVFESENDFADNPRAFYEFLKNNTTYLDDKKIIWFVEKADYCERHFKEKNVIFINRKTNSFFKRIKLNYILATSKWFIFSHPWWFKNWRRKQIVINVSHGIAPMKGISNKIVDKVFDYAICTCEYTSHFIAENFVCNTNRILDIGVPRIDELFSIDSIIDRLIPNYNNQRVILSMETFKQSKNYLDSEFNDKYSLNVVRSMHDLKLLDDFLIKNDSILIIKIHHLQDVSLLRKIDLTNIVYLTDDDLFYADVQVNQLLVNSDILLTDYSSVFYDYLLLNKPIGFMVSDIKEYSRGFVYNNPLEEMPGIKISNINELIDFIRETFNGIDNYSKDRRTILNKVVYYQDSKNCEVD